MDDRLVYYREKLKSIEKSNGKKNKGDNVMNDILTPMDIDEMLFSLRNRVLELTSYSIRLSNRVKKLEERFLRLQKNQIALRKMTDAIFLNKKRR